MEVNLKDLSRFYAPCELSSLPFECPIEKLELLLVKESRGPLNLSEQDPNQAVIAARRKDSLLNSPPHEEVEERKKVYKPGPFARFYEAQEGVLDKDALVWYYKKDKDITGPVSSYNMDKMAYFQNIDPETRVAFQSVKKFVKFEKILRSLEEEDHGQ